MSAAVKKERCPACAVLGKDTAADNLDIYASGKFNCIAYPGDKAHNARICELRPDLAPPPTPFSWPELERGTASDFRRLAHLRDVDAGSLKIMSVRGLLRCADFNAGRAYVAVDPNLRNAQARLLSGQRWSRPDTMTRSPRKDTGAIHGWPIGITAAAPFPAIALVEGVPDFISVLHHAAPHGLEGRIAPVMLPGAGVRIVADALPLFAGKRVRIFVHEDIRGIDAFSRWSGQLIEAGAVVDGFIFDGLMQSNRKRVKDLNDLCRIDVDSWETHRDTVEGVMDFATERILCPE